MFNRDRQEAILIDQVLSKYKLVDDEDDRAHPTVRRLKPVVRLLGRLYEHDMLTQPDRKFIFDLGMFVEGQFTESELMQKGQEYIQTGRFNGIQKNIMAGLVIVAGMGLLAAGGLALASGAGLAMGAALTAAGGVILSALGGYMVAAGVMAGTGLVLAATGIFAARARSLLAPPQDEIHQAVREGVGRVLVHGR